MVLKILTTLWLCLVFAVPSDAQEWKGDGKGHEDWHGSFYSKLVRKDTKTSCCSLADCSPTTARMNYEKGYWEVMVEGVWTEVKEIHIQRISAPDGGAHVCAPKQNHPHVGVIYCVVLPPET